MGRRLELLLALFLCSRHRLRRRLKRHPECRLLSPVFCRLPSLVFLRHLLFCVVCCLASRSPTSATGKGLGHGKLQHLLSIFDTYLPASALTFQLQRPKQSDRKTSKIET